MRRPAVVALLALLVPAAAKAQDRPVVEIGTSLGVTLLDAGGSVTHIGIPGMGILGQPTIYAGFYAGKKLLVEPQIAFNRISGGGDSFTTLGFGGQVGFHPKGTGANSVFIAGNFATQHVSDGNDSDTEFGLGGKVGYRVLSGRSLGVRFEGGFRHWFDGGVNEISFGMSLGAIVH